MLFLFLLFQFFYKISLFVEVKCHGLSPIPLNFFVHWQFMVDQKFKCTFKFFSVFMFLDVLPRFNICISYWLHNIKLFAFFVLFLNTFFAIFNGFLRHGFFYDGGKTFFYEVTLLNYLFIDFIKLTFVETLADSIVIYFFFAVLSAKL